MAQATRRTLCAALAAVLARPSLAQPDFPNRPVRLIVPFPAGGTVNGIARLFAENFARFADQPMVVDNRPGAGGTIAEQAVIRAPADGYTLLFATLGALVINAFTYRQSADNARLLAPIGMVSETPMVLIAHNAMPASVAALLDHAAAHPEAVSFATPGNGTMPHLLAERFAARAGIRLLHVPYQGGSAQLTDVLAGRTNLTFDSLLSAISMLQAGTVRALAVTSPQRVPQLPAVPTMAEAGLPDLTYGFWTSIAAPAATPEPVRSRLAAILAETLRAPETEQAFAQFGVVPKPATPAEFQALLDRERALWRPVAERIAATMR